MQVAPFGRALYVCVLLAPAIACTPIPDFKKSGADPSTAVARAASPDQDAGTLRVSVASATADMQCNQADARSCASDDPRKVLVCQGGSWHPDTSCSAEARCVPKGKMAIDCLPSIADCVGQEPGFIFCDAAGKRRGCLDEARATELACDTLERCVVENGAPKCRCVPGAVFQNGCVIATSCDTDNGGCDPVTTCTSGPGGRECGQCPVSLGYLGDGASGCAPQLLSLIPSCGELEPALQPGVYNYKLHASIFCSQLYIDGLAPDGSSVKVNAVDVAAQWSWDSPPLHIGETTLAVDVTSGFGETTQYTFEIERNVKQVAYLKASNAEADDNFGQTLASSGDVVFVGTGWEDSSSAADPASNNAADSGAVYVFAPQRDTWVELPYLKADPVIAGEYFGSALAVEGDTLIVGAPNRDPVQWYRRNGQAPAIRSGAVYVFQRVQDSWKLQTRLTPSAGSAGDVFGHTVALRGNTLLVGAPADAPNGTEVGAVYVFSRVGGAWSEVQKISPPDSGSNSMFGMALALDAERIVVGAPQDAKLAQSGGTAFTFVLDSGKWRFEQRIDPMSAGTAKTFGYWTQLASDELLIGAPGIEGANPRGAIHPFRLEGGAWKEGKSVQPPYSRQADLFGAHALLYGPMLVVSANGDSSGAEGIDGDGSRSDSYLSGAVHMFAPDGSGGWRSTTYFKADAPGPMDYFGVSVATGTSALFVGAPAEDSASRKINEGADDNNATNSGAVYVFR